MPAQPPCQDTREHVRGDKRNSPALDLTHVGVLMVAAIAAKRISADDHVPEGHSPEADEVGESRAEAAVKFERAGGAGRALLNRASRDRRAGRPGLLARPMHTKTNEARAVFSS